MNEGKFAVVQTNFAAIPDAVIERALLAYTPWPRIDVKRLALAARGILATRFTAAEARAVQADLQRAGYATQILPVDQMMSLPRSRNIAWLDVTLDDLGIPLDAHLPTTTRVPWTSVFAIHASLVAMQLEPIQLADTESEVWRPPSREEPRPAHGVLVPVLGILALSAEGKLLHVRLSLQRFILSRMPWIDSTLRRPEQFRVVLATLIANSSQALVSPEARALAAALPRDQGERLPISRVDRDDQAFQAQMNWLLQLLALGQSAAVRPAVP